jgi:hypothetical protein
MFQGDLDIEDTYIIPEKRPYLGCPLIQGVCYEGQIGSVQPAAEVRRTNRQRHLGCPECRIELRPSSMPADEDQYRKAVKYKSLQHLGRGSTSSSVRVEDGPERTGSSGKRRVSLFICHREIKLNPVATTSYHSILSTGHELSGSGIKSCLTPY